MPQPVASRRLASLKEAGAREPSVSETYLRECYIYVAADEWLDRSIPGNSQALCGGYTW